MELLQLYIQSILVVGSNDKAMVDWFPMALTASRAPSSSASLGIQSLPGASFVTSS